MLNQSADDTMVAVAHSVEKGGLAARVGGVDAGDARSHHVHNAPREPTRGRRTLVGGVGGGDAGG